MQSQALPGFRDFFPLETARRNRIFHVWRDVAARYGFQEYDGPPLEPLDLYTQKSGDEIVGQLYSFEDKGGRAVALRPEMTPTLARMVAARAQGLKKPIRWFSIPQLFRYERQQRGRLREHFQLNMDLIGEASPLADAEVIAAAVDVLRAFGLGADAVRVRMSDRRVAAALLGGVGVTADQLAATYLQIDKLGREPHEALVAALVEHAGLATEAAAAALAVGNVKGMAEVREALAGVPRGDEIGEPLEVCVEALESMGLGGFVDVDLSIVRGLAYYTGIVFELFDAQRSLRAICGGGRYDGLLSAMGGTDLAAVGFGMGDVVLAELLDEHGIDRAAPTSAEVFLVAVTAEDMGHVLALAHELRDRGIGVEYALKQQSLVKQLKLAGARDARVAVVVGPDERASGVLTVRDLAKGTEEQVPRDRLFERIVSSTSGDEADG